MPRLSPSFFVTMHLLYHPSCSSQPHLTTAAKDEYTSDKMSDISVYIALSNMELSKYGADIMVSPRRRFAHLMRLAYQEFQRLGKLPSGLDESLFEIYLVDARSYKTADLLMGCDGSGFHARRVCPYEFLSGYQITLEDSSQVFVLHHPKISIS